MADDSTATTPDQPSEDVQVNVEAPKPTDDVPPEVKAALRKANKEAETLRLRLKEYEDRDKTEAEKQAERFKALEAEAVSARTEALRLRVATKFGISDEHADLFLTGADEASLTKQAEAVQALREGSKKQGNYVAREGSPTSTGGPQGDDREFVRNLFRNAD